MNKTPEKNFQSFLKKSIAKHGNKFDYSKTIYLDCKTPIEIICPKHGLFTINPTGHYESKTGCPKCSTEDVHNNQRKTTEWFIDKAKNVHGDNYDYSLVEYIKSQKYVKIRCKKHDFIFEQWPSNHLYGKGCPKCKLDFLHNKFAMTKEEFIKKANLKHNNKFNYSLVNYINCDKNVEIICPLHGNFVQSPYHHLRSPFGCPTCSGEISFQEREIYSFIVNRGINCVGQSRKIIPPLELDIYIPDKNIAIEYNGIFWHSESLCGKVDYHLEKTASCRAKGINLIHIFENEMINNRKLVFSNLSKILGILKYNIDSHSLQINMVSEELKSKFLNKYHLQQDCQSDINIGLFKKNKLVYLMCFSDKKNGVYELLRYCSINNFNFLNAKGRLLNYFEENYHPKLLITFVDRRWDNGDILMNHGFKFIMNTSPNCWYFKRGFRDLYSSSEFSKNTLEKKLKIFDNNLSEWDNMKNNGWNRIWDCGQSVYHKSYE